ncbi:halocarboxylic acid dehydrogenase DehI family protein [Bacillus fonticola]|uniref:halocarboxylic acid dehydrogenase DehI family protein n=1 Tax=Bacillus fonticola TaxID=2728853 RepID=UPI001474B14F|nr:halocarboxylic acid dehydrogenase DehI family protein [Bacillus fonticola]
MQKNYNVPEVFPEDAVGAVNTLYADIQFVLKVPVVNFLFRTLAFYERFLELAWSEVRTNMLTFEVEEMAKELRYPPVSLQTPSWDWQAHYPPKTIEAIKRTIFTFNYVNPKLLLLVSAWSESLSNRPILGKNEPKGFLQPGILPGLPQIQLIHIKQAPEPTRRLLLTISKTLGTFDVASDYRALANYPQFLSTGWGVLKPYASTDEYTLLQTSLKKRAVTLAHKFPFPVTISRGKLERYYTEKEIAGIYGIVSMFQSFLPGLLIDLEIFRRIISG